MRRLPTAALLCLVLALVAVACGGDDEQEQQGGVEAPAARAPELPRNVEAIAAAIATDLTARPEIPKPQGDPPTRLIVEDVVAGDGLEAKAGDQVTVHYAGTSWSTGEEFDASWNTGQPLAFPLGQGQVIPGWDQGVAGMKPGGRRLLVIPPELGYGPEGQPPVIAANETLVFVVDLRRIG